MASIKDQKMEYSIFSRLAQSHGIDHASQVAIKSGCANATVVQWTRQWNDQNHELLSAFMRMGGKLNE